MKQILLVEDEPLIANAVKRGLSYKGFDVMIAWNGEEVFNILHSYFPDLAIVDILLPGIDGYEVCSRLRGGRGKDLPIILLTARDEVSDKIVGLESGADDYMLKPFVFDELLAHIRVSLRRVEERTQPSQMLYIADITIDMMARKATRAGYVIELTRREFDLFAILSKHRGYVVTKEDILEQVWGYDNENGLEVVKIYVQSLQEKLKDANAGNLIERVQGGYTINASSSSSNTRQSSS